jgi:adenylate cyclase
LSKNVNFAEVEDLFRQFAKARNLYAEPKWSEAQNEFQNILDRWPEDGPSPMYWKRCQDYLFGEPPANCDGVFNMTHK